MFSNTTSVNKVTLASGDNSHPSEVDRDWMQPVVEIKEAGDESRAILMGPALRRMSKTTCRQSPAAEILLD